MSGNSLTRRERLMRAADGGSEMLLHSIGALEPPPCLMVLDATPCAFTDPHARNPILAGARCSETTYVGIDRPGRAAKVLADRAGHTLSSWCPTMDRVDRAEQ